MSIFDRKNMLGCGTDSDCYSLIPVNSPTNDADLGKSIKEISMLIGRGLTTGEINMCRTIFKDSIQYSRVRIIEARHPSEDTSKVPRVIADKRNPYIFFPPKDTQPARSVHYYRDDFSSPQGSSLEKRKTRLLFIHEMTHIWQRMQGKYSLDNPALQGKAKETGDIYYLPWQDEPAKEFSLYNHEQQAELIATLYDIEILKTNMPPEKVTYIKNATQKFISNPKGIKLLPVNAKDRKPINE
ncbi:hypothetical protein QU487_11735 [Crenobacter sp. SG2305]|uniref:hypothetical protein n=1 Tax=Crenobacter oryzisoli TaxID=3056844 RepID=UPI0025AA86E4|nr:hypothetical protein [Crenobacter sp. SG2305]MDN0083415.1 hypothetical protein [Crenobacter sp. SG2305]